MYLIHKKIVDGLKLIGAGESFEADLSQLFVDLKKDNEPFIIDKNKYSW